MLDKLPSELLHKIIIFASPLISISITPPPTTPTPITNNTNTPLYYFETNPPSIILSLALTNSTIYNSLKFVQNPWLFSKVFERTFDFDAPRRRLGTEWAGSHGCAWEGRKRWAMIQRMKNAVRIWENDGYYNFRWMDTYGEEEIRLDLWTIYLMLLENDGKNAILLTLGAKLGRFVEMLCRIHFGRRMTRRVGWPSLTEERSLLAWILVAVDPMPNDFMDQDLYQQTKLCMRAFIFASFKYSLGVLPPTYFLHPSSLNPSYYTHQIPPTSLLPYPLNPLSSIRYASWTPPLEPPVYKYSNDNLIPIIIYAHTVYLYPPSLAVAALLWYFRETGAAGGMVMTPVLNSPEEYSEEEKETTQKKSKGNETPDTTTSSATSSSNPTSTTRSLFNTFRIDPHSWTTPFLFSIPLAPSSLSLLNPQRNSSIPQSTINKWFRNELYRRRFNAASRQLDQEWTRRLEGQMRFNGPSRVEGFVPGSLEGVWEGGFLFLEFQDYAQFLTGEKEATPDFYQSPPDTIYGSNRQVWRLKEYELQTFVEEEEVTRSRYASPNGLGPSSPMGMDTTLGSNIPLSIGRWMDGWLPPAEKLKWQFPGDGGELEIVEILKSDGVSKEEKERRMVDERRRIRESMPITAEEGTSSTQVVVTGTSQDDYIKHGDGDDEETEEEWQMEKAGVAGKLRGRSSAKNKNRPPALELHSETSSVTPVARPLAGLPPLVSPNTVSSPNSSRSQAPTVTPSSRFVYTDTNTNVDTSTLSPPISRSLSPSPTAKVDKGGSKRFSWGWKNRDKKEKKGSKSKKGKQQQQQPPPVTYQKVEMEAEKNTREFRPSTSTREGTFDTMEEPGIDDRNDVVDEFDERVKEGSEVVERVSRYVRWDPNVAWAKQAIWGNREGGAGGVATPSNQQQGNVRKMTGSTSSPTDPSIPGSMKSGSATSRGRRQVGDILVFGQSHSSWGEATIRGRIRSHDGLITLVKTYPQRATWIYTGYVIAGECLVGRWRDASSPEEVNGYEGPFAMRRRR